MNKSWRFFPLETLSPIENMAIDEALFRAKIKTPDLPNSFRLYCWNPSAVSCGKHQDINKEIDIDQAKKSNVEIIRRITGGGSVYHDYNGEITYSLVMSLDQITNHDSENLVFDILQGLQKGFKNIGLNTTYDKIHCPSLFVNGKKISGNAQARHGNILLQHGTILIDYNPEEMYSILKARPDKPREKMIESVYSYVTTIKNELDNKSDINYNVVADQFINGFKETFSNYNWIKGYYNDYETNLIQLLKNNKYNNENWTINKIELGFH